MACYFEVGDSYGKWEELYCVIYDRLCLGKDTSYHPTKEQWRDELNRLIEQYKE